MKKKIISIKYFSKFSFFFFSFFLTGFTVVQDTANLKVLNPALKDVQTLKIKLKNGLKVLIISDPETKISACALGLNTGSWQDPSQYPGMAHFVEHMLFHGSKTYPESDGFAHFLSSHGGSRNGYTSFLETVYYFSLPNSNIDEGLDRFSRFFIDPLFDPNSTSKELYAVDEEYKMHMINDNYRAFQVEKALTNPKHPHSLFNIGSKEILASIPREDLLKWYQTHYSSNIMSLVFYTNLPPKKTARLIDQKFSQIQNRHIQREKIQESLFSDKQKGHVVYIEPLKDLKKFSIEWELDPALAENDSSLRFLAYVLNRSGENSLLSLLKEKNLIESCRFSSQLLGKDHALFSAEFTLTDKGLQNLDLIIAYLEDSFATLQKELPNQELFDEMNRAASLEYAYKSRQSPEEETVFFTSALLKKDFAAFPDAVFLADKYSPEELKRILSSLTLENGFFEVIAKEKLTLIKPEMTEKWTQSQYTVTALPAEWLKPQNLAGVKFKLPAINPFIPQNLALLPTLQTEPLQVVKNSSAETFFQQSKLTAEPKVNYQLLFSSPQIGAALKSQVLTDLFLLHFQREENGLIKEASLGGIEFDMAQKDLKLNLAISGFSDKTTDFLHTILKKIKELGLSQKQFLEYRQNLQETYANRQKNMALKQALEEASYLLRNYKYPADLLVQETGKINYDEYLFFLKNLFQKGFLESTLVGNLTAEKAKEITSQIETVLAFQSAAKTEFAVSDLPAENTVIYKPTTQAGSALVLMADQSPFSHKKRALQLLANSILSEAFFHTLRSEEKVGYIAHAQDLEIKDHLYTFFFLQSDGFSGENLLNRSEIFLQNFVKNADKSISPERFEALKQDLLSVLKKPAQNLNELAERLCKSAFVYQDLDYFEKINTALEKATYEEFLSFIQSSFAFENARKTAIIAQMEKPASLTEPYVFLDDKASKKGKKLKELSQAAK